MNVVTTNLAAIQLIKKWYEDLETQALLQLDLSPFDSLMDQDKERQLVIETYAYPI